jgi:8-oxo-dGTP diphosphatase
VNDEPLPSPFYRVSVKALVFDAHDRLLVVQEPDGFWELPGGGWEHGETLEECLTRELAEELGAELRSVDLATVHPCVGPGRSYQRLKLAVRAEISDREPTPGNEILALRWVTRDEIAGLPMRDGDDTMRAHIQATWPT